MKARQRSGSKDEDGEDGGRQRRVESEASGGQGWQWGRRRRRRRWQCNGDAVEEGCLSGWASRLVLFPIRVYSFVHSTRRAYRLRYRSRYVKRKA